MKKLKNDCASTSLFTVRVAPVFLFFCFFLIVFTVTFFPSFHSIAVPSLFFGNSSSSSSSPKMNVFFKLVFVKYSFSLKWNVSVKFWLSLLCSNSIFVISFSSSSSFSPNTSKSP